AKLSFFGACAPFAFFGPAPGGHRAKRVRAKEIAPSASRHGSKGAGNSAEDHDADARGRALRRSDFPSQRQRLSLLMSRRRAASHLPTNGEPRKQTTFNSLAGTRTARSDGRSSPPAAKCA